MRLSFRFRYVMFDIPKSASTSINFALSRVSECVLDGNGGLKHLRVTDYEQFLEPMLLKCSHAPVSEFDRIAVVREPIDMIMSYYKYLRRSGVEDPGHVDHRRHTLDINFEEFCQSVVNEYRGRSQVRYSVSRPASFLKTQDGTIGVDTIFAFDRLDSFARYMSEKTGSEISIPMRNVSAKGADLSIGQSLYEDLRQIMADDFKLYDLTKEAGDEPLRIRGQTL